MQYDTVQKLYRIWNSWLSIWVGSCLTCKHYGILERLAGAKHQLLQKIITNGLKKFNNIGSWSCILLIMNEHNKLECFSWQFIIAKCIEAILLSGPIHRLQRKCSFLNMVSQLLLGNCDIDFFNFRHCQVWNFEILTQSKQNQNFTVNFQKHWKWKRKSTKYIETERKQTIIPRNFVKFCYFHEISLTFVKSHNFL